MLWRTAILVVFSTLAVLALLPLLIVCAIGGRREPLLVYARALVRVGRAVLGLGLCVEGGEHGKGRTPSVFMANHVSFLDGPLLFMLIPNLRVILKKSLFRIPILGLAMKFVGFVPVDRRGGRGGRVGIERAVAMMRDKGVSFLIFPEGTRSRDGNLQEFRRGGFFLAHLAGAPVVPVSVRGAFDLMPRHRWIPRRGTVGIRFHPPLPAGGNSPDEIRILMDRVKSAIASGLQGESHD